MIDVNKFVPVPRSNRSYPVGDFIHETHDKGDNIPLSNILLILSTPRSGSTYLCEELYNHTGALGHEYYQPHGYIQYLAKRWGALKEENAIDAKYFTKRLIKHRSCGGTLIINLHGSHLKLFIKFLPFFPSVELKAIHLIRASLIDQAVSYALASRTLEWSSAYSLADKERVLDLSDHEINSKIEIINQQTITINSFLACYGIAHLSILYENIRNEMPRVAQFLNITIGKSTKPKAAKSLKKQSSELSAYTKTSYALRKLGLSERND